MVLLKSNTFLIHRPLDSITEISILWDVEASFLSSEMNMYWKCKDICSSQQRAT